MRIPESDPGPVSDSNLRNGLPEIENDQIPNLSRAELEGLFRKVWTAFSRLLSAVKAVRETPIGKQEPERLRMAAKWRERRNEQLKEENRELQRENERLRQELKARKATEAINWNHWRGRAAVLQSELNTAREKARELEKELDRVRGKEVEKTREAIRLARAVATGQADGYRDGPEWSSAAQLFSCLSGWTADSDDMDELSRSTVKRRFERGLLAREENGIDIAETVRRCEDPLQYLD
jgi:hypothetical protein